MFANEPFCTIRSIDPAAEAEIDLVAQRMRQTLIEVEGEATGTALYTLDWLRDRVRFHLDPAQCEGWVMLAETPGGEVLGHCIVRVEKDDEGAPFGLFSTTYVVPEARRHGVAVQLLLAGEAWMQARALPRSATWTSATNTKLIGLYEKHGYAIDARHSHATTGTNMVRLARRLTAVIAA